MTVTALGEVMPESKDTPETSIASSIIPFSRDDDRARWLGYRACGMSVREALKLVGKSKATLSYWRHNEVDGEIFSDLEIRIPEFRKELSKEYVEIEFFRNFRLALEKDYRILMKSLEKDKVLDKQEQEYLIKLRSQYTPQQLQILEAIVSDGGGGWNFAKWVSQNPDIVQLSRTDTVTVRRPDADEA